MSFPRYPKYKASGVEWLGDVPDHWGVSPLKYFAAIDSCGSYGVEPDSAEIVLPVATTAQIDSAGQFAVDRMPLRGFTSIEVQRYGCSDGDILIVKSSGSATNIISGKAGLVDEHTPSFVFSNFLMRVRPDRRYGLPKFVYALLSSNLTRQRVELMCSTTTYPNLQIPNYTSASLPVPPLPEQTAIAEFLDRETGKIDELVAEQRRLMELLKEKRQAVISHAVTKGLNPHAPMKPSGIEWLGDVPVGWVIGKLGYACKLKGGFAFAAGDFGTDGVAVVKMNNLKRGRLDLSEAARIPESSCNESVSLCEGDLVWGMSGSTGETGSLGNFARVCGADLPCQLNQRVGRFKADTTKLDLNFIEQVIQTPYFYEQIMLLVTGTAQYNVSSEQVQSCIFALPPLSEQTTIVEFLRTELAKFDTLTAEAQRATDLLQERRTALISAAVTGQIDVRQPPKN